MVSRIVTWVKFAVQYDYPKDRNALQLAYGLRDQRQMQKVSRSSRSRTIPAKPSQKRMAAHNYTPDRGVGLLVKHALGARHGTLPNGIGLSTSPKITEL